MVSIWSIGVLVGSVMYSFIANKFGRKWPLMSLSIPIIVSTNPKWNKKRNYLVMCQMECKKRKIKTLEIFFSILFHNETKVKKNFYLCVLEAIQQHTGYKLIIPATRISWIEYFSSRFTGELAAHYICTKSVLFAHSTNDTGHSQRWYLFIVSILFRWDRW